KQLPQLVRYQPLDQVCHALTNDHPRPKETVSKAGVGQRGQGRYSSEVQQLQQPTTPGGAHQHPSGSLYDR
ncbi:hypothetical protein, partial [Streptomyces sp. NPDC002265]|uniref:hypothetical protein n=1 Tax=Streptomyces sp. NPDC002265 TaxID=3154415 RepID=UPI003325C2E4